MLETLPAEEFPDAVVFLETSARPFVYGVKPIIDAVAEKRGLHLPAMRFMVTFRPETMRISYSDMLQRRAQEIVMETGAKNVLIADEYVYGGNSFIAVHRVLSQVTAENHGHVSGFVFGIEDERIPGKEFLRYIGDTDTRMTFGTMNSELINSESLNRHLTRDGDHQTCPRVFDGFSLRLRGDKENLIGVTKMFYRQRKHVLRSPDADPKLMLALRREIKEVAQRVIKEKNP